MTTRQLHGAHRVAVLVSDGVALAEAGQAGDVFRAAAHAADAVEPRYEVMLCAPRRGGCAAGRDTTWTSP